MAAAGGGRSPCRPSDEAERPTGQASRQRGRARRSQTTHASGHGSGSWPFAVLVGIATGRARAGTGEPRSADTTAGTMASAASDRIEGGAVRVASLEESTVSLRLRAALRSLRALRGSDLRAPGVGEELVEPVRIPPRAELAEDVGEVRQRRDPIEGAGPRQAVEVRCAPRRVMRAGEQVVLPVHGHVAQLLFDEVMPPPGLCRARPVVVVRPVRPSPVSLARAA